MINHYFKVIENRLENKKALCINRFVRRTDIMSDEKSTSKKGTKKSKKDENQVVEEAKTEKKQIKYEWDPSDGITYHDFIGLFLGFFIFIWKLVRIVVYPVIWIIGENKKMIKFIKSTSDDSPMDKPQRQFFESLPLIFTFTGLIGGILVGIVAVVGLSNQIREFFANIDVLDAFRDFFGFIWYIIKGIWSLLSQLFGGIWFVIKGLYDWLVGLLGGDPFFALIVLVALGLLFFVIVVLVRESGLVGKIKTKLMDIFEDIIGSPDVLRERLSKAYRNFNHRFTSIFVGQERIMTRTQAFFKSVAFYTVLMSIWTLLSGFVIAFRYGLTEDRNELETIFFFAFVLLFSGLISGVLILSFFSILLDSVSRDKYLANREKVLEIYPNVDEILKTSKKKTKKAETEKDEPEPEPEE
jgi:hypothetical protein